MCDIFFDVCYDTFRLAAKSWGDSSAKPMLLYPGWLDNAGSFDSIAPVLADRGYYVIALDPPGCGKSDHLPKICTINDYDEPPLILDVADILGWTTFTLAGHSRGGGVVSAVAGAWPDRVTALVIFDSAMGLSMGFPYEAPLAKTMASYRLRADRSQKRKPRKFASVEEAVMRNYHHPMFRKHYTTAKNITKRHLRPCKDGSGFEFTHDTRTYGQSSRMYVSSNDSLELLRRIKCPVILIRAADGFGSQPSEKHYLDKYIKPRISAISNLTVELVQGGHHVHSDEPWIVGRKVADFLDKCSLDSTDQIPSKL
mmetsp:Transcript_36648/g.71920  ORF Transcript_36648/g.71920 Transcript_36648/m.71920 type:complete len:312 (+) Transcript_36648:59-994(+)